MRKPPESTCPRCGRVRKTWDAGLCSCCRDVALSLGQGDLWGVKNEAPKTPRKGKRMCNKGTHEIRSEADVYRLPSKPDWEFCRACKRHNRRKSERRKAAA